MHLTLTYPIQSSGRFFTRSKVRGYCFGFNGKEKVDEVYGDANAYDFGSRIYDPRLGRFFSIDPKAGNFAFQSPYIYAINSPISFIDREGEDNIIYLVILPSAKEKLSKADWKAVQENANKYFRIMGLPTRVVIRPHNDFNVDYIDPTDSFVLVGKPDEMRKFMTNADGSLKSEKYGKFYETIKNWSGDSKNPEESAVGDYDYRDGKQAALAPGIAINSDFIGDMAKLAEITIEEMLGITIVHGATHNAGLKVGVFHHPDGASQSAAALINFLSGTTTIRETGDGKHVNSNKHKPEEIYNPDDNVEVRKAIKSTFGTSFNKDNYESNKSKANNK